MKVKSIFFATLLFLSTIKLSPAQSIHDVFAPTVPVTWYGVDFTEVRYFGETGTVDTREMITLFSSINMLLISEPDKYQIGKFFYKKQVMPSLSMMDAHNKKTDPDRIISLDFAEYNRMDVEFIKKMVSRLNFGSDKGLGLMFIMEGLNKTKKEAAMWITYVNVETKEVVFTARVTGQPGGFGFRNHWAGSILEVMERVYRSEYKKWKKEFIK
jgi:hypothetical protein